MMIIVVVVFSLFGRSIEIFYFTAQQFAHFNALTTLVREIMSLRLSSIIRRANENNFWRFKLMMISARVGASKREKVFLIDLFSSSSTQLPHENREREKMKIALW
jgi:hypothetical protein